MDRPAKEIDPFRPPSAPLDVPAVASEAAFFTASPLKFVLMSIATFAIYDLWWFYRNFKAIRERTGRPIMPFWRAFFAVIWSYSCFKEIGESSGGDGNRHGAAAFLALLYGVFAITSRLPDPWWLLSFGAIAPVMVANAWARQANQSIAPGHAENASFSGWNWLALVIGFPLLILAVIATLGESP